MTADNRWNRLTICADVTALMLRGRLGRLKVLVHDSLAAGEITRRFFEELMIHLSLVLGFPHMLQGLEILAETAPRDRSSGLRKTGSQSLRARGLRTFRRVYGSQSGRVLLFLETLTHGMADWILENVYGRVYARRGLSLAEREVVTIVALNHHRHVKQLVGHLRGSLRSGLDVDELRALLLRLQKRHRMSTAKAMTFLREIERRRGGDRTP